MAATTTTTPTTTPIPLPTAIPSGAAHHRVRRIVQIAIAGFVAVGAIVVGFDSTPTTEVTPTDGPAAVDQVTALRRLVALGYVSSASVTAAREQAVTRDLQRQGLVPTGSTATTAVDEDAELARLQSHGLVPSGPAVPVERAEDVELRRLQTRGLVPTGR